MYIRGGNTHPPLFLAHCGAGEVLYAPVLGKHIDPDVAVYALPAKSADEAPLRTVQAMATRMVEMIRSLQPVGPYRIAGWSFGGILAYEVAAQLIGMDQEVEFLGMLDSHYAAGKNSVKNRTDAGNYVVRLLDLMENLGNLDQEQCGALAEIKSNIGKMDLESFVQECQRRFLLPESWMHLSAPQVQRRINRNDAYWLAGAQYFAQPLPVTVHLFSSLERNRQNLSLGWESVVPKRLLRVTGVPGTHYSMMLSPNVELLGEAISSAICNKSEKVLQLPEKGYSPIVVLQAGRASEQPLFCVPGAGANVTQFVDMVASLDRVQPVYGLQPRGLDGLLVPYSTVEVAAESYLRAVSDICPGGSIRLLGHSFGGWVAFEMAQRVFTAGRVVASLILIDSKPPDDKEGSFCEYDSIEVIVALAEVFEQLLEKPLGISYSSLANLNEKSRLDLLRSQLILAGLFPTRSRSDDLRGPTQAFATALRTHYCPKAPYAGPTRLIVMDDRKLGPRENWQKQMEVAEKWRRWAPNLTVARAPGNHMTALKAPHVQALVRFIQGD